MTAGAGPVRSTLGAALLALGAPLLVLGAVWWPELRHYHVATPVIDAGVIETLRQSPGDDVLARLDDIRYGLEEAAPADSVSKAEEILAGRFHTLGGAMLPLALAPDDAGLLQGSPGDQLEIGSMAPADTLLAAYRATRDERFFDAALASVVAWARYERTARAPHGFLWNDHAVAARVLVIASLWREYRQHPRYDAQTAGDLLAFAARSAALLARPDHYTARTNHGIMQDLGLLHAAAAFPALPATGAQVAVALDRLGAHLPYYVSPGGVVLEHSTGYQDFAIHLLHSAMVYGELLRLTLPADLPGRYAAAECWQRGLVRADGTLPVQGDTWNGRRSAAVVAEAAGVTCPAGGGPRLDADFGYALVPAFDGADAQLFMAWANFAGRAHKHDDELAAWIWARGTDWWGASGYWPYGDGGRAAAASWRGANAPHGVGEPDGAGGTSRLRAYRLDGPVRLLDVERSAADGRRYRRQVAGIDGLGVLVLDTAGGGTPGMRFESVWTAPPGVIFSSAAPELADGSPADARVVAAAFAGGQDFALRRLKAARDPFGALVAVDSAILDSTAVEMSAADGAWTAAAWSPAGSPVTPLSIGMSAWAGAEQWSLSLATPSGTSVIARSGRRLTVTGAGIARREAVLEDPPPGRPALEEATAAYRGAAARFPAFRDLRQYRARASAGIGGLALLQFAALWVATRLGLGRRWPLVLVTVGWVAAGSWLYYVYLV